MTRAIALAALLILAWAVLRRRPVEPPEDEVQPPDPRTVYLVSLSRGDPRIGTFSAN